MRTRETIKVLGGSIAVYVIMAACAASSGTPPAVSKDGGLAGGGGSGGSSGGSGSGGGSDDGPSILDALTDPVSEANASPTVNTVPCSGTYDDGGGTYSYAEQAYPGMTATDLSAVRAIATYTSTPGSVVLPGYSSIVVGPFVRDGFVAVICGNPSAPTYESVTFVLP